MDVLHFQKTQHSHIFNIGKREISTLNAIIYVRLSYMNFSFEVGKKMNQQILYITIIK